MDGGSLRVVIVGGGRVGLRTARLLDDRGYTPVVIERDERRCEELSEAYVATIIEGDATAPETLHQSDPANADAVLGLTGDTGTNLTVCLLADRLADGIRTVMRVIEDDAGAYSEYVDAVIDPERAGARIAANAVETDVRALEDVSGGVAILEMTVAEGAPVAGRTLDAVSLPRGALVVSDVAGDAIAGPETMLEPGRSFLIGAEPAVEDEVVNLFRG